MNGNSANKTKNWGARKLHSKQPQQLAVCLAYRQVSTINGRPGTLLPYLSRIMPGIRYLVYIMLVPGVWLHPRPFSWGAEIPCLHHNLDLSQTAPAGVPSVLVPTGLSRPTHQLQLRLHKRWDKTNWKQRSNAFHRGQQQFLVFSKEFLRPG